MDEDFDAIEMAADDILGIVEHAREDLSAIGIPGQFSPAETLGPEPGFLERTEDFLIDKFLPEVGNMLVREWNLGASEISKALFGESDAAVLYGPALVPIQPVEMAEQSFDDMIRDASERSAPDREQGLER